MPGWATTYEQEGFVSLAFLECRCLLKFELEYSRSNLLVEQARCAMILLSECSTIFPEGNGGKFILPFIVWLGRKVPPA